MSSLVIDLICFSVHIFVCEIEGFDGEIDYTQGFISIQHRTAFEQLGLSCFLNNYVIELW